MKSYLVGVVVALQVRRVEVKGGNMVNGHNELHEPIESFLLVEGQLFVGEIVGKDRFYLILAEDDAEFLEEHEKVRTSEMPSG